MFSTTPCSRKKGKRREVRREKRKEAMREKPGMGRNIPQLDVAGAVSAKTGETPGKTTSPELALCLQTTYTCNFLPNCLKASIITKIKRPLRALSLTTITNKSIIA